MKKSFVLIVLLLSFATSFSKTYKGSINLKNGNTKTGWIKSFLEEKIINLNLIDNLEHELNLDDQKVLFKANENDDYETITIDEIDEIILEFENKESTTFKAIELREITNDGEVKEEGKKVFLPYIKKGKIAIFAIRYNETSNNPYAGTTFAASNMRFYYQNSNKDYAINYQNIKTIALFSIKKRITNPLIDLFYDCPEIINELENSLNSKADNAKQMRKEYNESIKEFKKLSKEERNNLKTYHKYHFVTIEKMIEKYETCN